MAPSLTTWILLVFAGHAMATWTFSPSCYRLQDIEYDWVTAWLKCQELGAHLAIERDTDEHLGLSQYLQGLGRTEDYWIGGRKSLDTAPLLHSSFQWITEFRGTQNKCQGGSDRVNCTEMGVGLTCEVLGCCWDNTTTTPGLPACYFPSTQGPFDSSTNWLTGEPNNTPSPEMCVEEKYSAGGHSWNDKSCLLPTRSICETFLTCVHPLTDQKVPCGYTITRTCPPGMATASPTLLCESSITVGTFMGTMGWNGTYDPCIDIDECLEGTHNCHPDAYCINSPSPFSCVCNQGFIGDGWTCAPYSTQPDSQATPPVGTSAPAGPGPGVSQNPGSLVPGVSPNPAGSLVPGVSPNLGTSVQGVSQNLGPLVPGVSQSPGSLDPGSSAPGVSQNPGSAGVGASSHPGTSAGGVLQRPGSVGVGVSPQPGPGSGSSQGPGSAGGAASQADSSMGSNDVTASKPGAANCGPCDWADWKGMSGAMVVVMNNIGGTSDNLAVAAITLVVCLLLFLLGCLLAYLIRKLRNRKAVEQAPPEYNNVGPRQTKADVPSETESFTTETTGREKGAVTPAWSPISMYRGKSSRVW
ncbi:uncharacterized protein LOC144862988 [Branchiostoma floridae x Branchiostoma japonicum]